MEGLIFGILRYSDMLSILRERLAEILASYSQSELFVVLNIFVFNKHLLLQSHLQHPLRAFPHAAMQGFALLHNTLLNTNEPSPLPFSAITVQRHSGVKTAIHCQYLPSFRIHDDQLFHCPIHDTCTVTYHTDSPSIDAINKIPAIKFGSIHSFLTLLTYSDVILPFILLLRVCSNCKMPKYLKPSSSTYFRMGWFTYRSIPLSLRSNDRYLSIRSSTFVVSDNVFEVTKGKSKDYFTILIREKVSKVTDCRAVLEIRQKSAKSQNLE